MRHVRLTASGQRGVVNQAASNIYINVAFTITIYL